MLNQCIIVGRIYRVDTDGITLLVARPDEEIGDVVVPVAIGPVMLSNLKEYAKVGDLIGVRGRLDNKDNSLMLLANKITTLSSKGGELDE